MQLKDVNLGWSVCTGFRWSVSPDFPVCDYIEKDYNEFEQTTTFSTPPLKNCSLIKVIDKKRSTYYLSLRAEGRTVNVGEIGVKIILSNNQIISYPNEKIKVDVPSNGSGWNYSAFVTILPDKLQLFKKYKIKKWQLFIYDESQDDYDAEIFRNMVICMVGLK